MHRSVFSRAHSWSAPGHIHAPALLLCHCGFDGRASQMRVRSRHSKQLRQAWLAWAMTLSMVLAWIGAPLSLTTLSAIDASYGVSVSTAPSHVATLSATTKVQRPAELRHGLDSHTADLPAEALHLPVDVELAFHVRTVEAPARSRDGTTSQPRAPPLT